MSGAVAAHAAYNGSGTQGLAVTNKIHDDDGDVMSVFWNKNDTTRQLLFGSAFVEVPTSGGSGTNSITSDNNVIFDVNNDIDCLGDMVLNVKYTNTSPGSPLPAALTSQQLANLVSRIEVQVGTQIWQTFENADLLALASTELSSGSFADFCFQTTGGVTDNNQFSNAAPGAVPVNGTANAYIPIKLFTKTLGPRLENFAEQTESGYLMAAAPHQQVKVKVYTSRQTTITGTLELALYAKNQVMCNEEREQMKAMPMGLPKRIKMTQNKSYSIGTANPPSLDIDLDIFSLYASHIIISIPKGSLAVTDVYSGYAELLLNSSSFSGKLPLGLLKLTGSTMGLFTNEYWDANVNTSSNLTFVFPLASQAYGGSSVPLNRFDNIRLKLTSLPTSSGLSAGDIVNITCVGETTALYKGGAASLAMY